MATAGPVIGGGRRDSAHPGVDDPLRRLPSSPAYRPECAERPDEQPAQRVIDPGAHRKLEVRE